MQGGAQLFIIDLWVAVAGTHQMLVLQTARSVGNVVQTAEGY